MNFWQNIPNIRDVRAENDGKSYTNTSLIRATNILICLSNGINTNTEIAKYCKYSTSTVHRLLNVMQNLNWVVQDVINHRYYLGPVANQLISNQGNAHRYLLVNALQEMGHLSNFSGETISLNILVQLRSVLLHFIPSDQELKIVEDGSGHVAPFAMGATAKVLLSQLEEKEIREALNRIDFKKLMGKRAVSRELLAAQLRDIKRKGYGISYGERITGAMCISTPVQGYSHPVALSILGPENRIKPRARAITEELIASAKRISRSIVYNIKKD
jgi:IclR family acetate operon transcriptional repressor